MNSIIKVNKSYLEKVNKLVSGSNFKPYRYLMREIPIERLNNYVNKRISDTFSSKLSTYYGYLQNGELLGTGLLEMLKWDSDIFEIKMARVRNLIENDNSIGLKNKLLKFIIQECKDKGINHLSCKVYSDDITSIHTLERNGFRLMDTLLDYVFDFRKYSIQEFNPPCIIRPFNEKDIESIVELARKTFSSHFGRFNVDRKLRGKADKLYSEWAKNSCEGYGDIVFVAELNKKVVGYSVWKTVNWSKKLLGINIGSYSIAAVHPDAYGKGIFKALTLAGMKWLKGKVDIVEGPTHINNYPVQRGYTTLTWKIVDARHTFHKWIKRK